MSKVKSKYIDFGLGTNQVKASDIPLDTTNFNNNLSTSDTNLQLALDTIDSMAGGGIAGPGSTEDNAIARWNGITGAAIQNSGCYIDDSGRLGVGISAPTYALHVCDESNTMAGFYQYGDVDGAALRLCRAKGSIAAPTAILNGDSMGAIRGIGYDGTAFARSSNVDFIASENWTTSAHGTFIQFGITPNGSTTTAEGMRLTQDKYLGIGGVASPAAGLDVESHSNNIPVKFGGTSGVISNYWYNSTSSHYCTNLYYENSSSSWKFGKGSSSQYGAIYKMAGANGSHQWYSTSAAGNADATASPTQIMTLSQAGVLDVIGGFTVGGNPVGGGGLTWSTITGATSVVKSNAYFCNNASTRVVATLPATAAVGDTIKIAGQGSAGWRLSAASGDTIRFGNQVTTSGGYLQSTNQYDVVEVTCMVADTTWLVTSGVGNLTVA